MSVFGLMFDGAQATAPAGGDGGGGDIRITEAGDTRITEAGDTRIQEAA